MCVQEGDMLWLFLVVVQLLQQYASVPSISHLSTSDYEVLEAFMSLANMTLSWNFSTRIRMIFYYIYCYTILQK